MIKMMPHIAHTSTRIMDYGDLLPGDHEMMRMEENIASLQFPVMRTTGDSSVIGPIFDLPALVHWVRKKGTDPVTRRPINWDDFEALRWLDPPPPGQHRRYNFRVTERFLKLLKKGTIGQQDPNQAANNDSDISSSSSDGDNDHDDGAISPTDVRALYRQFFGEELQ